MGRAIGECQGCWICGQLSRALSFEKPDTHGVFATRQYDQLLIPMLHINTVSAPKTVDATTHHTSLARKCAASGNESLDSPVCMSRDRGTRTAALGLHRLQSSLLRIPVRVSRDRGARTAALGPTPSLSCSYRRQRLPRLPSHAGRKTPRQPMKPSRRRTPGLG